MNALFLSWLVRRRELRRWRKEHCAGEGQGGDCSGHWSHTPGLTDSPRHKSRWVFPSNYAPSQWLQTLVWQNLSRAKNCTWNVKKGKEECSTCGIMYRWLKVKNYGSNTSCQTLSAQAESSSSGGLCYTTHTQGDSPILSAVTVSHHPWLLLKLEAASPWLTPSLTPLGKGQAAVGECLAEVGMILKAASLPRAPQHCAACNGSAGHHGPKSTSEGCPYLCYNCLPFHSPPQAQPLIHSHTFFGKEIHTHTYWNKNTNILQKAQ